MKNFFIFNLDEVIVKTRSRFHAFIESELLNFWELVDISPSDILRRFSDFSAKEIFLALRENCDVAFLMEKKWEMMCELAEHQEMECLPEMYDLICDLEANGNEVLIISQAPKKWIEVCLKRALTKSDKSVPGKSLTEIFQGKYFSAENFPEPEYMPGVFHQALNSYCQLRGLSLESILGKFYLITNNREDVVAGLSFEMNVYYFCFSNEAFSNERLVSKFNAPQILVNHCRQKFLL